MKYVITGGPCSGKTTLIDKLKSGDFGFAEEAAREILAKGNHLSFYELQKKIFDLQIKREQRIDAEDKIHFLDRGWIDNHAYFKHHTGSIPDYFLKANVAPYDKIFVLDRLPLVNDAVRREDEKTAAALHQQIIDSYKNAGYTPVRVPVMSVEERKHFVLDHVFTHQLIKR